MEPIRLDRNKNRGGVFYYSSEDIPTSPIEGFFIEINLYKRKLFLCYSYSPDSNNIHNHLSALGVRLDIHSSQYEHFIEAENRDIEELCKNYNLKSLIRVPTYYKNVNNPSCIDLILTNSQGSFQSSCAIETGLSDSHKMTATVMKTSFRKLKPKAIHYRKYKRFCNESYRNKLIANFSKQNFEENSLEKFLEVCNKLFDKHATSDSTFV